MAEGLVLALSKEKTDTGVFPVLQRGKGGKRFSFYFLPRGGGKKKKPPKKRGRRFGRLTLTFAKEKRVSNQGGNVPLGGGGEEGAAFWAGFYFSHQEKKKEEKTFARWASRLGGKGGALRVFPVPFNLKEKKGGKPKTLPRGGGRGGGVT